MSGTRRTRTTPARAPSRLAPLAFFSVIALLLAALYFASGDGRLDVTGHALGRDFVNYWTAGQLAVEGRIVDIFDPPVFLAAERQLFHPDLPFHFWSYPPPALLLVWPLGFLPYAAALALWSIAGLAALWFAARAFFPDRGDAAFLLLAPAVAVNIVLGQNGAFTAALLIGGLALLDRRPATAGILFGLLVFKPHLGLLLPVAVIAARRWTTFFAAAATAGAAVVLSILVFGLEPWRAFFDLALPVQTAMMDRGTGPFLWMMTSVFGGMRLLGLTGEAIWLQLPFFLFAAALTWRAFRSRRSPADRAAIVMLATFVATPQAFGYDLIPAAAAALVFARRNDSAPWSWAVWSLPLAGMLFALLRVPVAPLVLVWGLWEAFQTRGRIQGIRRA